MYTQALRHAPENVHKTLGSKALISVHHGDYENAFAAFFQTPGVLQEHTYFKSSFATYHQTAGVQSTFIFFSALSLFVVQHKSQKIVPLSVLHSYSTPSLLSPPFESYSSLRSHEKPECGSGTSLLESDSA